MQSTGLKYRCSSSCINNRGPKVPKQCRSSSRLLVCKAKPQEEEYDLVTRWVGKIFGKAAVGESRVTWRSRLHARKA
jgi:hypothetical protein